MRELAARALGSYDYHRGAQPLLRQTGTFRGFFFVGANLLGFVAVNAFLHYLATGRWLDFSGDSYRRALITPLSDIFIRPPSIFAFPWMIVVGGLLVGAVVFVPIVVAVLYRLWVSGLFVLAVMLVGHAPLLAACLAGGCAVAAVTRLRSDLPFLAFLAGLVSATVTYLVPYHLFAPGGAAKLLLPLEQLVLLIPFILAGVSVVVAGGAVLWLARLTRFRPGVIWPVLLIFVAAPVGLFYVKVGPAELACGALVEGLEPCDAVFQPCSDGPGAGVQPTTAEGSADDVNSRRAELLAKCDELLRKYPRHDRSAEVLWIKASLLAAGGDPAAAGVWNELADRHPRGPQAMIARYHLGVKAIRDQRIEKAAEHLRIAHTELMKYLAAKAAGRDTGLWARAFSRPEPLPAVEFYRQVLAGLSRIIWLMEVNKVAQGDEDNVRAFAEYMRRWPFTHSSPKQLLALAAGAEKTELADNFRLQAALSRTDRWGRAYELSVVAKEVNDAAIVANYELGRLALQLGDDAMRTEGYESAREYFRIVVNAPENPYRVDAKRHLRWIEQKRSTTANP